MVADEPSPTSIKRKHNEIEGGQQSSTHPTGAPKASIDSRHISLSQLQERHLSAAKPTTQAPHPLHHSSPSSTSLPFPNTNSTTTQSQGGAVDGGRAVIFPESRGQEEPQHRISRDFAQEFHQSVLQTTRQQEISKLGNGCFYSSHSTYVHLDAKHCKL